MKYACIGHEVYFANHFLEEDGSRNNTRAFCYDHYSYRPFTQLLAYAPDATLVYRPDLFTDVLIKSIPGIKIGFSSEPLPTNNDEISNSTETRIRETAYRALPANSFDFFYHYDLNSSIWFIQNGFHVHGYRPLPINTSVFNPLGGTCKDIDFLFIGKATSYRIHILDRFRSFPFRFMWIAHGVWGVELAALFKRSKCILNIHADSRPQFEPRVLLGLACGIPVISEPLGCDLFPMSKFVHLVNFDKLSLDELYLLLNEHTHTNEEIMDNWKKYMIEISARHFVDSCVENYINFY